MLKNYISCAMVCILAALTLYSCSPDRSSGTERSEEGSALIGISTVEGSPSAIPKADEESSKLIESTDGASEGSPANEGGISRESFTVLYKNEPVSLEGVDLDRLYQLVDEAGKNTDMMLNEMILNEEMEEGKRSGLYLEVVKPYKNQRGETLITYVIITNGGGCCCTGFGSKILLTRQTVSDILDTLGTDLQS